MLTTFLLVVTLLSGSWCSPASSLALKDLPHPRAWPCPDEEAILPCVCKVEADESLVMNCSDVKSNLELERVFQQSFPFRDFKSLVIKHSAPPPSEFDTLRAGVFGPVTFQYIDITGTNLRTIVDEALATSHPTLMTLHLQDNSIESFPFETLPLYDHLYELNLSGNQISGPLPDLASDRLRFINLSGNNGLSVAETSFTECTVVEELHLANMGLGEHPVNVFSGLNFIDTIDLSQNVLAGVLSQHTINPLYGTLERLKLSNNTLTNIDPRAITNLVREASVDFRFNVISTLEEKDWSNLLTQVDLANAIDLRDNPLLCGCDVFWLVLDRDTMVKIHDETMCQNNQLLHDLPLDFFVDHC